MSRSLRTNDFSGLKPYQVDAIKKEMKNKQNRDRKGNQHKNVQQNLHHTTDYQDDSYYVDEFAAYA